MRRRFVILGAVALATLVGAGVAHASIPDADGTIHACYHKSTGALRVIDSADTCPSAYAPLNWEQAGADTPGLAIQRVRETLTVPGDAAPTYFGITAYCPPGTVVISGGFQTTGGPPDANAPVDVLNSYSTAFIGAGNEGWQVSARVSTPGTRGTVYVDAYCADMSPG